MREQPLKTMYSICGNYRYEIFLREDGMFQVWLQKKIQYTDYIGNAYTDWHDIKDYTHIADSCECAEKIGYEGLCNLTGAV